MSEDLREQLEASLGAGQAVRHYEAFIRLWAQCDPDLRPTVDDARQRVERLGRATAAR